MNANETRPVPTTRAVAAPGTTGAASALRAFGWVLAVIGGGLLIALSAQVKLPLPGTPVPMTLQTLAVLMAALTLGPRLGTLAVGFYLALGLTGWGVFALGTWATAGYLAAFLLVPTLVNAVAPTGRRSAGRLAAALVLANVAIFGLGAAMLACSLNLIDHRAASLAFVLQLGVWSFLPGNVIQSVLAALLSGVIDRGRRALS